jgi:hypothetical protein
MITAEDRADSREAKEVLARITPMLVGLSPPVVGMIVGELAARFIACHGPEWRAGAREMLSQFINVMVPAAVDEMIKSGHVSEEEWRGPTIQ